jgi:hypothetical protein
MTIASRWRLFYRKHGVACCCLFSMGMVLIVSARPLAFLSLDVGFCSQLTYHQRTNRLRRKLKP